MIEYIQVVVELPIESEPAGTAFWATALGSPLGRPWAESADTASFEPPDGSPFVHRQQVAGPPGVHLEVAVADLDRAADALVTLGASTIRASDDRQRLTSPGGLAFFLISALPKRVRPSAALWTTGHRSRLMQVSIDCPPARHDREVDFWRAATGWRWGPVGRAEFTGKLYPAPGSTLQLLLHRLGDDDGGDTVRAHLDLGTDDLELETARLVAAGATRLWHGSGWVTLRDPAGLLFCATHNSPDAP